MMIARVLLLVPVLAGCASTAASSSRGSETPTRVLTEGAVADAGPISMEIQVADRATASSITVAAPAARAFHAAQAAYAALGIEAGELDHAGLVVGNPRVQVRRTLAGRPAAYFLDCGRSSTGQPLANSQRVQFSVRTTVAPTDANRSRVSTIVSNGAARSVTGVSSDPVLCVSTGALEQVIAEQVRSALQPEPR